MNATTIQAVLSLAETLLPLIAAGLTTAYADLKTLLASISDTAAATPADIAAAQKLAAMADAAQDSAYAAYEAARAKAGA